MASTAEPLHRYALIAGLSYLGIFVLAISGNFAVVESLVVRGDPAGTWAALQGGETVMRLGVAALLIVLVLDVFAGWALYHLTRPVDAPLAGLTLLFRFAYTISHIGVLLLLVFALRLVDGAGGEVIAEETTALVTYGFMRAHGMGFTITLLFFGVHLVLLGMLFVRGGALPRLIGVLVMIAGAGYMADALLVTGWEGYAQLPGWAPLAIVIVPALIGEGLLMLWLLFVGSRCRRWHDGAA